VSRAYWPALDVSLPARFQSNLIDLILAALDDHSPSALDGPSAPEASIRAYFIDESRRNDAIDALTAFASHGVIVRAVAVPDEGWAERSQSALRPISVGRITVAPPWHHVQELNGQIAITINPSMGFGTGHHPTTRLCLHALQQVDLDDRRVLDIGTGSGILAIAAARLGASQVVGLDCDPDAVQSAEENVVSNGLVEQVQIRLGDFRDLPLLASADLVTANLTGAMLSVHADRLLSCAASSERLIVSGFTARETAGILAAFGHAAVLIDQVSEDEWRAATFATGKAAGH
jgi:ribosomal protein L11 methyltransferase